MAAGDLITTDFQFEWNGVLIGTGTRYILQTARGFGLPSVRSNDSDRTRQHGMVRGLDRLSGRTIDLGFVILGSSNADLETKLSALDALLMIDDTEAPLVWRFSNQSERRASCRLRELDYPVDIAFGMRQANVVMRFFATDPLLYSNDEHSLVTSREQSGSGFTPPFTPPFALGASTGGSMTVTNGGTTSAPWVARLDGPLEFPEITHLESGRRLALALSANGGVDLASGEYLVLDSAARSVLLNGTSDRRSQLTIDSQWWDLDPGVNSFMLAADSGAGTLTVTWRDAWLS